MTTSYPQTAPAVNPALQVPSRVLSFYRWLYRWYGQTADLHAATGYYARKQKVSERTVYRWLAYLRANGFIVTEQTIGVERRITPQVEPPRKRTRLHTISYAVSGVCQGSVSGVSSSMVSDAYEASTSAEVVNAVPAAPASDLSPAAPVEAVSAGADEVKCLCSVGMSPRIALNLVNQHGMKAVRNALAAYQQAKDVRNPVGWVVKAVERRYQFAPESACEGRTEAKKVILAYSPGPDTLDGLHGKAAFDAMRAKMAVAGRVSR